MHLPSVKKNGVEMEYRVNVKSKKTDTYLRKVYGVRDLRFVRIRTMEYSRFVFLRISYLRLF